MSGRLGHHGGAQLEDARCRGPGADQLDDPVRIEAGLEAEHEGFGRGDIVDRDQEIGDELHAAAVAEGAEVVVLAREIGEEGPERRDSPGIAARIDDEVLDGGLRAGAAQGAVQRDVPGLAENPFHPELVVERERAGLDDDAPLDLRSGDLLRHLDHGPRMRQARDDGRRLPRDLGRVRRDLDAGIGQFRPPRRVHVETDHVPAGRREVPRHGAAHDAEADDADTLHLVLRRRSGRPPALDGLRRMLMIPSTRGQ